MDPYHIVRTTTALYPDLIGGHAVHCHDLSVIQGKVGHRVDVITRKRGLASSFEHVADSYSVFRLRSSWLPWMTLGLDNPYLPALPTYLRALNPDIIHAHSHLFLA